jgi:glycosyltransferase involved in cell wall biosynthesis
MRCIDPLLDCLECQTIGIENIEIIFVDDFSVDGTRMKLKEFQQNHPQNVQIIENDKNYGVSYSRNRGVENSHAPYVTFADHDDVLERTLYETLYENIVKNECEIVMCAHDYITEKDKNTGRGVYEADDGQEWYSSQIFELQDNVQRNQFMLQFRNDLECWSKLIRKSFLLEHTIVFPEGMWGEDFYWWSLIEMHLNSLCWIPNVLYHHARKDGQAASKEIDNWMSAQLLLNQEAKRRGIYQDFSEILDLELFEIGFASTVYYWVLGNNFSVQELEGLRRDVIRETTDIFHNPYICSKNFRYRYSEYALELLKEEITERTIRDFLKSIVAVLKAL